MYLTMFIRQSKQIKKFLNLNPNCILKRNSQHATKPKDQICQKDIIYFSSPREKVREQKPLLKSLLFSDMDKTIFQKSEPQTVDRFKDFFDWLKPIQNYILSCTDANKTLDKTEILTNLKNLGVFRACVDEQYQGLGLTETELLMLMETLGALPWLSTYLVQNQIIPYKIISKYGSDSQKLEYCPKIMSTEMIPTVCVKEENNATNINNIKCQAVPYEEDSWLLSGEKSFVVNGVNANLFLVFAKILTNNIFDQKSVSLFLIERNHETMTCNRVYETIGRNQIPMCTINFDNTVVTRKNIIGEPGGALQLMLELLKPGNQTISGQAIAILRNFLNRLILDVLEIKQLDRHFYQFEFVKKIISKTVISLYTMESMAYFTSSLVDLYENIDVELERIITETYCANKCLECIQSGLHIMGANSYLNDNFYIQTFHDALALMTIDTNNLDANMYVGAAAFQHLGKFTYETVIKRRNPQEYPWYRVMTQWFTIKPKKINIKDCLHPSLEFGSYYLENSINSMVESMFVIFDQYGAEVLSHEIQMTRVTKMLTEIYATIANLSRSSRSYSIGLHNGETEKNMAVAHAYMTYNKVNAIKKEIEEGDLLNADHIHKCLADLSYDQHKYCMEHPLNRNF
ncbi:complex I assembly factor ACAD9, mitochondrial [Ptiloglossa arizonensis]|uniref:complex I assembly factor ACAD9, mitochondrial n=1 Tax=Ptiloglossa arizonensis TaxID=3350558 RepID=UPI003FA0027B